MTGAKKAPNPKGGMDNWVRSHCRASNEGTKIPINYYKDLIVYA